MITKKNILYSSFIGLKVEIRSSSQRELIGILGTVVDETKNLIVIEKNSGGEIKVPKVSSLFRFGLENDEFVDVDGRMIVFRPHERPKKV